MTDVEYSRALRDWLNTVRLPASNLLGPKPRFMVIDPSATSFKVQLYQDGWNVADGVNAVVDGIRLVSTLLAIDRLKIHRSCKGLIDEIPGYSWDEGYARVATTRALWQRIPSQLESTEPARNLDQSLYV